jgi:hypothetical protein
MEDAKAKWEKIQMDAARAWANLDIAIEMVENNRKELSISQYAEVKAKIDEQQEMIQDMMLSGLAEYRIATAGPENYVKVDLEDL